MKTLRQLATFAAAAVAVIAGRVAAVTLARLLTAAGVKLPTP